MNNFSFIVSIYEPIHNNAHKHILKRRLYASRCSSFQSTLFQILDRRGFNLSIVMKTKTKVTVITLVDPNSLMNQSNLEAKPPIVLILFPELTDNAKRSHLEVLLKKESQSVVKQNQSKREC